MSIRPPPMPRGATRRPVVRLDAEGGASGSPSARDADADEVVVEEPLEIRVAGETVATTMRTPGHDRQLAIGFLFAEGLVASRDDVGTVAHCGRPGDEGFGNVIDVTPGPGTLIDVERLGASRRGTLVTTAACGVCGRRSIDDLLARCGPQPDAAARVRVAPATITAAVGRMRDAQQLFTRTGGIHAAGLFDADGTPRAVFEDVGRHNAVDKAIGQLVLDGALPRPTRGDGDASTAGPALLLVSGRASFEMVQKAVAAGVPVVASVSAPSSLAIDLATRTGTTLVGFVRGARLNVYAVPERVAP